MAFKVALRRDPTRWLWLVIAVAGVYIVETYHAGSDVLWPTAVSALGHSLTFIAPLGAGTAAISGTRAGRPGLTALEAGSPRPIAVASSPPLVASLMWLALTFLAPLAAVAVPGAFTIQGAFPSLHVVALAVAYVGTCMLGYLVGRRARYWFTPPLVAASVYVADFATANRASGIGNLVPTDQRVYDQFTGPGGWADVGKIVWFVAVAALAWALLIGGRPRGRRRITGVPVVGAAGAAAVCAALAILTTTGSSAYGPLTIEWTCSGTALKVCLNPPFAHESARLRTQLAPVAQRLSSTHFALSRVEQRPRGFGSTPSAGAASFALDNLTSASLAAVNADVATSALHLDFDSCLSSDGQLKEAFWFNSVVAAYVAYGSVDSFGPVDADSAAAKTAFPKITDVKAWLNAHANALADCTLTLHDFR